MMSFQGAAGLFVSGFAAFTLDDGAVSDFLGSRTSGFSLVDALSCL